MTEALLLAAEEQADLKVQHREAPDLSVQLLLSVRAVRMFLLHSSRVY